MKHYLLFFIAFILFSCSAQKKFVTDTTYVIQITDPQFGFFNENKSFEKETENYQRAINAVNRLKPAAVFVTGDLVNIPFNKQQVDEYKRISARSVVPLYSIPGNHDVGNQPAMNDILNYRSAFGKDYYSANINGNLFVLLNSLYLHKPDKVEDEAKKQKSWLIATLQSASSDSNIKHIIVILHHPFFLKEPNEPTEYFNIPLETRKEYLVLFKQNRVSHIFAGHYHRNSFGMFNDMEMVTNGPVGKPLGADSSGLRIIKIKGDNITHKYFSLDQIPASLRDF